MYNISLELYSTGKDISKIYWWFCETLLEKNDRAVNGYDLALLIDFRS